MKNKKNFYKLYRNVKMQKYNSNFSSKYSKKKYRKTHSYHKLVRHMSCVAKL